MKQIPIFEVLSRNHRCKALLISKLLSCFDTINISVAHLLDSMHTLVWNQWSMIPKSDRGVQGDPFHWPAKPRRWNAKYLSVGNCLGTKFRNLQWLVLEVFLRGLRGQLEVWGLEWESWPLLSQHLGSTKTIRGKVFAGNVDFVLGYCLHPLLCLNHIPKSVETVTVRFVTCAQRPFCSCRVYKQADSREAILIECDCNEDERDHRGGHPKCID